MLDLSDIEEASHGEEELIWEIKSTLEEGKEEELLNTEWVNCALFEYDEQGLAYIPGVDETQVRLNGVYKDNDRNLIVNDENDEPILFGENLIWVSSKYFLPIDEGESGKKG